ncbi:MAG TPA: glycosyltransferase family 4 protein [Pyrinomonadaceae bacterium]|jgi:glycosyltransferase involved in cell wall biosynthesis
MSKYSIDKFIADIRDANPWYRPAESVRTSMREARTVGVNVCGYLRDESGWGAAGRGYVRALRALGVPLALLDLSSLSSNRSEDKTLSSFDSAHPYDINLVCVDAGQHYALMSEVGEEFFERRYNIGAWAWELPRFPEKWYDRFAFYDEIWVGTSFIANVLAPISPVPVVRVPPVLAATSQGTRDAGRRRLKVAAGEFVYLFIFDFHSHLERKNPLTLVDAFKRAFKPSEAARLIIKCVNEASDPTGYRTLREQSHDAAISIHTGYWSSDEMRDLMAACDAYVSLHRSEGTGLTISDAMAHSKPVIATGWSGNMDFMNVSNSYPVKYELVKIRENVGPYRAGETWAAASVEHAAELMRRIYEEREEAAAIGVAAKRDIEANYSEEKIGSLIRQRLEVIATRERFAVFRREIRAFQEGYRQLIASIRDAVRAAIPAEARMLVISKGDPQLLQHDQQRAAHFPQATDGQYAGHHPATSREAIAHLEELRGKSGAQYLLIPATAMWWLEHYREFGEELERRFDEVWKDESCIIFRLSDKE